MSFAERANIGFADSGAVTAFGRLRAAQPVSLFQSKLLADARPLDWDDAQTSGAGTSSTYNTNQASVTLGVGVTTAGTRVRQSKVWFNYQPGRGQLVLMSAVIGAGLAGITRRVGLFETNNGLYFELAGTTLNVVRRTFTSGVVVNNAVPQASWNIDKMNGSGPSGITLDTSKTNIYVIDFEWLGVGRVRMGVNVNGVTFYCHEFLNANNLTLVYMQIPNLPCRYEISNDGTAASASLVCICCNVSAEGGATEVGQTFSASRTAVMTTLNSTVIFPLISIRRQANRSYVFVSPVNVDLVCSTAATVFNWYLILNPTVAGVALAFTGISGSVIEADLVSTNATSVTGGTIIQGGTAAAGTKSTVETTSQVSDFRLGVTLANVQDIIVLAVQRLTGTTESFYGTINWHESY